MNKQSRLVLLIVISAFLASACKEPRPGEGYQLSTSSDGRVYRLDKTTGEVWLIDGQSMTKIEERGPRLKAGKFYVGEDLYSFKYLGKGQFSAAKTLDELLGIRTPEEKGRATASE